MLDPLSNPAVFSHFETTSTTILSSTKVLEDTVLKLKGGLAYPDSGQLTELKLSKYQPRKILVTHNEDKTVRFFDLSSTLLIPPENEPLKHAWPKPITSLTINIVDTLRDASLSERLSTAPRSKFLYNPYRLLARHCRWPFR
jgi:hypothetical protein